MIIIHLIKNQEYHNIAFMLISIALWYRAKYKYRILVRILLHLTLLFEESHDQTVLINSITNIVILPQWTYQTFFLFLTLRHPSQIYLVIFYSALSRSVELVKRNKFASIYYATSIVQQQSTILTQLPHHILSIDEGLNILYSNHGWKQLNFTKLSKRIIVDAIRKKQRKYLWLDHDDKITFEYLFKVQNNVFTLIQMQFANNQIELFDRLETQTNQLYHQLCQDYQKWNNLRVFKVIKESDLSILGQCTSDCRLLEHQLQTMDFLLQDLSFTRDQKIVDFFCKNYHQYLVKNYICNIIESMANRLFDHFTVVNLDFETGVPELIKGNKNTLMYLLYTFLYSTTFDLKRPKLKIEEKELRISVCILRVNMEKSGYDLEFSIYYPCTPKLIQIYATFFSQGEYEPQNDKEQLLLYMMLKCKQLSQQNNQEIQFVTDGDSLTVRFSVSVTLISQQQTQCNETISNPSNVNTMNDNILFVDLTFTKTISQTNHFQWKAKSQNPTNTVLPLKFDKALSETNSEKKEESQKQQQQQQQQSQSQDDPQIEQLLYPEFKDDVLLLLEDIIRQAYQEGLIDKESIGITQNTEGKVGAYSEIADSEILDSPTQFSPKLFKTPQMKPRILQSLRKDMIKKQLENVKQKKPNSSKNRQPTKTKQLSVLFSPSVMSKFANNLTKISTQKYKNHLFQGSLNSLNEIDDSKNQSLSHYQMFGSQVFKSRMLAHKRYWSHHVQITDMPKIFPQILCYVPNTKLIEIAKRFGNTTYGQQVVIREPLIVFEIHDAIKEYKKILEQGFQFYFILLYIQKQNEVIDFTNTIKANEKEIIKKFPSFKPTNIIGVSDKAQQLNLQFCANLNYIMSVNLNESQLKSSKGYIASLIDGNK